MKAYDATQIRNVALVSHTGAGKTTFVERLLFDAGVVSRMGSVQQGNATLDFEDEEVARNGSVSSGLAFLEHNGCKLNLIDTPGYIDFTGEVNAALRVADNAALFVEAVGGVEVGTEIVWQAAKQRRIPIMLVVNKMDRDTARHQRVKESIETHLDGRVVEAQLPIGEGTSFRGVVDLVEMQAIIDGKVTDIPDELADAASEARDALIEVAVEGDDALMEKYFDDEPLSSAEIKRGLAAMMLSGDAYPIFYCAGEPGIGTAQLLDGLTDLTVSPFDRGKFTARRENTETEKYPIHDESPLAAFVFKTREDAYGKTSYLRVFGGVLGSDSRVWNASTGEEVRIGQLGAVLGKELKSLDKLRAGDIGAVVKLNDTDTNQTLIDKSNGAFKLRTITVPKPIMSVALSPASQSDVAKMASSLQRLSNEDPTLVTHYETATKETILSGMGDVHLDLAVKKLKSKFGVSVTTELPKVPYLETITRSSKADYTHKKQTGGAGQYARVFLRVESIDDNADVEFGSEIFGGAISQPFVAATEKGVRAQCDQGIIGGFPVKGMRVIVYDGKEHPVDSKEIAFQVAGRECVKLAVQGADPALMEPIYAVEVTVPNDYVGDVMSDMNPRRGQVTAIEQDGPRTIVKANVPLSEMQRYLIDLRSMTQGRGVYRMAFAEYGRVPTHLQEKLIASVSNGDAH